MILAGFILFGLAVLLYLLSAKNRASSATLSRDADIAALIAEHDAQTFTSDEEREESEYRLYHAIRHIERLRNNAQRLPLPLFAIAPLLLLGASWLWYAQLGGNFALHWQALATRLQPAITRSLYLGELPQGLDEQAMHTYCQALQSRINRSENEQLATLGQCYSQYGNHAAALPVYQYLLRRTPNDDRIALQYAQASLFANPDQAMSAEVEAILVRLYQANPEDTLTGILLATAYTRADDRERALPVWRQLKARTASDHPFYDLIARSEAQLSGNRETGDSSTIQERPVSVRIPAALLARLPGNSQLFVMISSKDNPMPIAVEKLDPREMQTIRFTSEHSMSGGSFLERDDLVLRAFLSADGTVTGERLGEVRQDFHLDTHPTLEFPAP